jgi:hypothetical protein
VQIRFLTKGDLSYLGRGSLRIHPTSAPETTLPSDIDLASLRPSKDPEKIRNTRRKLISQEWGFLSYKDGDNELISASYL